MPLVLGLYVLIGIVAHLVFLGATFAPSNLWSWILLLFWPAPVAVIVGVAGLVAVIGAAFIAKVRDLFRARGA